MPLLNSSWQRIKTLNFYYLRTTTRNPARLFLILAWPVFELMIWGYTTLYIQKNQNQITNLLFLLLNAFIFWNLLWKAQQEISNQFIQDIFSRNFNNIFITPVKIWEIFFALIISSLVKLCLIFLLLVVSTYFLFSLNILKVNLWFSVFFVNLIIFGWILGVAAIALVLRFGYRFDFLTWALAFFIWPFSCVFYSRNDLPFLFKTISFITPPSYVFEAMRELIIEDKIEIFNLYLAGFLNLLYFLLVSIFLFVMLKWAKKSGNLANT